MSRPKICRKISGQPDIVYFKPSGIPLTELQESILSIDEYEAIHLKDLDRKEQEECAKMMGISQPTFHRLVLSARKKVADAIVNGKAIKIIGGNTHIVTRVHKGCCRGKNEHSNSKR
ncbi:MAG: DUF134 domain-containing protein [Candidatus Woesearchaeota archaeon]